MSKFSRLVKKAARGVKKVVTDPSKAFKELGKNVGGGMQIASHFVPNPAIRAGLNIGGSVLKGNNMKEHAMAGAQSLLPGALQKIGGNGPGANALARFVPGAPGPTAGGGAGNPLARLPIGDIVGSLGSSGGFSGGGGASDVVAPGSGAGGFNVPGLGRIGLSDVVDGAIAIGTGLEAYEANRQSNRLTGKALDMAGQSWSERAPLRRLGLDGLAVEQAPDLSSVFADPGNVYARSAHAPAPVAPLTPEASLLAPRKPKLGRLPARRSV